MPAETVLPASRLPLSAPACAPRLGGDLLAVFGLIAAGAIIYGRTLSYPFIALDDPGYVSGNPHVLGGLTWAGARWALTTFDLSNWHPLTWLSLMLDAQLYGANAGGFHLTNLLLHLASAILLFGWLRRVVAGFWPAALTAFFFVAHPLHVESVAWVTERKDVLSTLFFFLTLHAYTSYVRGGGTRAYLLAFAAFTLGLMAKPMLVTVPPLLLVLDFWPLRRIGGDGYGRAPWTSLLVEKIPFLVLAAATAGLTIAAQSQHAIVPLNQLPFDRRIASAALGCGAYLGKTFWPMNLGVYYQFWRGGSTLAPWAWGGALAAGTALTAAGWRLLPWVLAGWLWFLGMLVPVIGLVQVGSQAIADRYTYLPHVGLFIAICWTAAALVRARPGLRPWFGATAAVAVLACIGLSWRQVGFWCNDRTLFSQSLAVGGPSGRLEVLLGDALVGSGEREQAREAYRAALELDPDDVTAAAKWAVLAAAADHWEEMTAVLAAPCADPRAGTQLLDAFGSALLRTGHADQAELIFRRVQTSDPSDPFAHFGLGDLLLARQEVSAASVQYIAGLNLRDDWVPALARLATIYALSQDNDLHESALALARRSVELSQGTDLTSLDALGAAQASLGRWDDAIATTQAALELARRTGAPAGAADNCRARLLQYQRRDR